MARRAPPPLFLARQGYRLRRLSDAARLLPFLGAFLLLLPLLDNPPDTPRPVVADALYLFLIWGLLILGAAVIAPGLARTDPGEASSGAEDEAAPGPGPGPRAGSGPGSGPAGRDGS